MLFLSEKCYISNGSYQPPKTQAPATDVYSVYEFAVSFKGFSKASASSVIKKIEAGKSVTQREKPVEFFYNNLNGLPESMLDAKLQIANKELRELASKIQGIKMAVILINRGSMDEFRNRSEMSIDIPANIYPAEGLDLDTVTAEFNIVQKEIEI